MSSYGLKFINSSGTRVVGREEDNLKFIEKVTTHTNSTYAYMKYMTFTVTSTEFPIVYLYIPYDDVGTCSNASYTEMTDCMLGGGAWTWTNTDETNMAAVTNIYNTTGNTWEVTVIGATGGYAKNACLYVFNESGSTPSSDTHGLRVYKADGTTLAYDSGFKPLIAKWGAEFTSMPTGTLGVVHKEFDTGDWSTRGVSKPAFNCSVNSLIFSQRNSFFCFDGSMYWYLKYWRHYVSITSGGVAMWSIQCTTRNQFSSSDYSTTNSDCTGATSPFASSQGIWYYKNKTIPFIDGADYD